MKVFVVRGSTVARLIIPEINHCVYIPKIDQIPREILQHADFVFEVQSDGTVEFFKCRSYTKSKYFFNLDLALLFINDHYKRAVLKEVKMSCFEIWDLTTVGSIEQKMDLMKSCIKQLREGVL